MRMKQCFSVLLAVALMGSGEAEAKSLRTVLNQARRGDTQAMREVADVLWDGTSNHGVDRKNAVAWWKKAADAGDVRAMVILAEVYEKGLHLSVDMEEALKYYEQAARKGNKRARKRLFRIHEEAAGRGETEAMWLLASHYEEGYGTAKAPKKALEWYRRLAEQGDTEAWVKVFHATLPEAERGEAEALRLVARCYEKGVGTPCRLDKALECYEKLAALGDETAVEKVFELVRERAEQGDIGAMKKLIGYFETGYGTARSPEKALEWQRRLAAGGDAEAGRKLFEAVRAAAEAGDASAMYELGGMYERGEYTEADKAKALEWYKKAQNKGAEAVERLEVPEL